MGKTEGRRWLPLPAAPENDWSLQSDKLMVQAHHSKELFCCNGIIHVDCWISVMKVYLKRQISVDKPTVHAGFKSSHS